MEKERVYTYWHPLRNDSHVFILFAASRARLCKVHWVCVSQPCQLLRDVDFNSQNTAGLGIMEVEIHIS